MMNDFVRSLIKQHFQSLQRVRLQSTIGNNSDDIFVDFQGSQSQPTVIVLAAQNQSSAALVNSNTYAFLCSRDQQFGHPSLQAGRIPKSLLGTLFGEDGSTGNNWGTLWSNFSGYPLIIPLNGFVRFTSLNETLTPPATGSFFQVDISYFNLDLCDCDPTIPNAIPPLAHNG